MLRQEIMSSVTGWLGCVAVLWGASTPLLAQRELPLPSVSERVSTQPQPEKPRELRRPEIQVLDRKELPGGLVREKLCLPGFDPDETVPAIAIHPASGGPFPVAFTFHSFRGAKENLESWCRDLANRGIFALSIDAHLHGERSIDGVFHGDKIASLGGEYSIWVHQSAIGRTVKDVSVILDTLARRPDVDVSRVAVTGVSMGGSTAMVLAWREPRVRVVASIVGAVDFWWDVTKIPPGSDQEARKASCGSRLRELVDSIDPKTHFGRIPPKALFLANGGHDEYIDIESVRRFVKDLEPLYGKAPSRLRFLPFPDAGHGVTETMWKEAQDWIVQGLCEQPRPTRISIVNGRWHIDGEATYHGTKAEGLLLNARMVNTVFEDLKRPDFDAEANTDEFITQIPDYVAHGVRAFTLNLQGGMPGYEGAVNSAFQADGSLRDSYLHRVRRVIEACDRHGAVVVLGCFYQRQDQLLKDETAVRSGIVHVAQWIQARHFRNVVLEIANEFGHSGFDHRILKDPEGQVELIRLAKQTAPDLLVSTSGLGDGRLPESVARASDFLLIHFNSTSLADIPQRIGALKKYGKPIVCNEDEKTDRQGAEAAEICVANGASWGLMLEKVNQRFPFTFRGAADDPVVYAALKELSSTKASAGEPVESYYPPPESAGGWRKLDNPEDIHRLGGAEPARLSVLKQWLLQSDDRDFAAVVIRHGYIVLEVERGNSAKTDSRRVASVSKAVCATVLAIASEQSQHGLTPRKMKFDDPAFDFIPWAQPLSDPRKAKITVKQLLNHTSGICPEASGAPNDGSWEYILGHTGDERTAKLAFDPGTGCGYSTHALAHAALVCETVTGMPYDQFAIQALFKPLGIEHWWFQFYDGGEKIGRHPSHGLGMPARDLARIAYCMLQGGRWKDRQVIPK
jgi:hypothetical protein